jgi:hypothetical protein
MVILTKAGQMRSDHLLSVAWTSILLCIVVLSEVTWHAVPVFSQNTEETGDTFQISIAELGYRERVIPSPFGVADYTLRIPEAWELLEGSVFELDFSYALTWLSRSQDTAIPDLFGDLTISIDDQVQQIVTIDEGSIEHSRVRVDLPLSRFNDPDQIGRAHTIGITLNAGHLCEIPHIAQLVVHSTSLFTLVYRQDSVFADLALYPRPFYQRSFERDQVRFVLPDYPAEAELAAAMAIAARLGDLTYGMAISSTTDSLLLAQLESESEFHEHLIAVGRPDTNELIRELDQMGVLPVATRERELGLAIEGPAMAALTDTLVYTLVLTNTAQRSASSLSLVGVLSPYADLVDCDPSCIQDSETREIKWSVPSLDVGETASYTFSLHPSEAITDSVLENTVALLDATSDPVNVSTLATTVRSGFVEGAEQKPRYRADKRDYFFVQDGRAVPEHDGVVQEIISPWDQTRAILIVTGLSDEAISKASRAMSSRSQFPGLSGSFALVQGVHVFSTGSTEQEGVDFTFADLGYDDRLLRRYLTEASYTFDLPVEWRLTEAAHLTLHFTHSQRIKYETSSLTVLFNNTPAATVALTDQTALNGLVRVPLPPSQSDPRGNNRITIQVEMQPLDKCASTGEWISISSDSRFHLEHQRQSAPDLLLDFYPHPFDRQTDLGDVLFALPPEPSARECEQALQLAASLGRAAGGPDFAPAVALGDTWPEAQLHNYHLVAIGRPSRNPILSVINDRLPQPFLPGSDQIEQVLDGVALRLPPETSLGYVQLIRSPWNDERALLAATGTTDEAVGWAIELLAERRWQLGGTLALVRSGSEVRTIDARLLTRSGLAKAVTTAVPQLTAVATPAEAATVEPTSVALTTPSPGPTVTLPATRVYSTGQGSDELSRPAWLIPLVIASGVVVVAILVTAFLMRRKRRANL